MLGQTPEFRLIARHFVRPVSGVVLGIGDDCALVRPSADRELAISTDTLVSGRHFFADADPYGIGHKALAVNLSDLAAMGATPRWVTLALTLPQLDEVWLSELSRGLFSLADQHGVALIGGDTTRGPLSLTLTVIGEVPPGQALRRDGAKIGDDIWVSGTLGDAALALAHLQGRIQLDHDDFQSIAHRLHCPVPRVALGLALRGVAHAAIDISDGLLADLGHICERSGCAAQLFFEALPRSRVLQSVAEPLSHDCLLSGGDDYELCFTASPAQREKIADIARMLTLDLHRVGVMEAGNAEVKILDRHGQYFHPVKRGFDHFADSFPSL